jgi:hypothetical protein
MVESSCFQPDVTPGDRRRKVASVCSNSPTAHDRMNAPQSLIFRADDSLENQLNMKNAEN